ncbi:MAG: hypothetical protein JXA01_07420 [Dehalococcoidia bacterium]|nr:hypothetical protein [Dehalococcoidia bacterium]
MRTSISLLIIYITVLTVSGCISYTSHMQSTTINAENVTVQGNEMDFVYGMKGVGIDLPQSDFDEMKKAGIDILATEWGMEQEVEMARDFLDKAQQAGLKVVMDGGFSYTAWGFTDDDWDRLPKGKLPVWQKQHVQEWISALKDHPAIYAWDISNEFGENLPDGADIRGSGWPAGRITIEQLKTARTDVLAADPTRPVHARMYEWERDNMPDYIKGLLENRIADIISLNLYSNYLYKGKLQWPTVMEDVGEYCVDDIKRISPGSAVWLSIGAFEYSKKFQKPSVASLERDLKHASGIQDLDGITFFCWGPVSQWDSSCDWYLPDSGADLWAAIKRHIAEQK